jgi:hypothetical protein
MFTAGAVIGATAFKHIGFVAVLPISLSLIGIALLQVAQDFKQLFIKPD